MSLYKYILLETVSEKKKQRIQEILDDFFIEKFIKPTDMYKRFEDEDNKEAQENMIDMYLTRFNSEDAVNSMVNADPSGKGTYLNWMVKHYLMPIIKEKNINEWNAIVKIREKFDEDLYKIKEYLELFHENKADLKRRDKEVDINQYKSQQELFQVVRPYRSGKKQEEPLELSDLVDNRYYIEHGEADLIAEDEKHLVIVPKTKEASKFYACNTEWCTAYPREFESYNEDGTLFIFIYKRHIAKYDSDTMPDDVLVQIFVPYTGEDIEARDSIDDWYDDWKKDLRSYEKEIVTYLKNEPDHEYNLLDTDGEDKIPMDGGTYHLEKIDGKWHVTFRDWSNMYHYVEGETEFAKRLLEGDGHDLFYTGFMPELSDVIASYELKEDGMNILREEILKQLDSDDYPDKDELKNKAKNIKSLSDYGDFLETIDGDDYEDIEEDDFYDINVSLRTALQEAQENANESEAFYSVTNFILEKIGGDPKKPNHQGDKLAFETEFNMESEKDTLKSVINLHSDADHDDVEKYNHPYDDYHGYVTDELFTEMFIVRIDIHLN